jgi:hypothetical protein
VLSAQKKIERDLKQFIHFSCSTTTCIHFPFDAFMIHVWVNEGDKMIYVHTLLTYDDDDDVMVDGATS